MPAFTIRHSNLQQRGPVVELQLGVPPALEAVLRQAGQPVPSPIVVAAMIDTGASGTVVRDDIPQRLGLNPVGVIAIHTPASTGVRCSQFAMRLQFPSYVVEEAVVIAAPLQGQHVECLIGRDVLAHAVLVYTGYDNSFTLAF
jgi:hypothetical protein